MHAPVTVRKTSISAYSHLAAYIGMCTCYYAKPLKYLERPIFAQNDIEHFNMFRSEDFFDLVPSCHKNSQLYCIKDCDSSVFEAINLLGTYAVFFSVNMLK